MKPWILVPCLVSLREEFNELAPDRDKASDGAVGDPRHAATCSDHNPDESGSVPVRDKDKVNEVHAIDVDDDLRKSGWTMTRALEIIITRHREGRDNRLQNVIYNRRIWSASWGWTPRAYAGVNAHTEHAHFSARYTTARERDTKPWGLLTEAAAGRQDTEEQDMKLDPDQYGKIADAVWAKAGGTDSTNARWPGEKSMASFLMLAAMGGYDAVKALGALAGKDTVDEQALAVALLPLLSASDLEAVIRTGMTTADRLALADRLKS